MFNIGRMGREASVLRAIDKSQAIIEFKPDGTIVGANANFLAAMGYRLEEIEGQHHQMFVEPKYAKSEEYRKFWELLREGKFQSAMFKRIGKNGKVIYIQATYNPVYDRSGNVVKVVKLATDITLPTVKAKEAIDRSQAVISFTLDGIILEANSNFLNAMGYRLEEIEGQHHRMFVDKDYAASSAYTEFWNALRRGEFQAGEFERVGRDGRRIWIQASYNPIFDASGKPERITKYATDITAQKDVERQVVEIANSISRSSQEMNMAIGEIAKSMTVTRDSVGHVNSAVDRAKSVVSDLIGAANKMGQIVDLINGISGQINLLALNATIEAARAGEAGRGFAVVADEVKKLASRTTESTERIQEEIRAAQQLTETMGASLENIVSLVDVVTEGTSGVAAATEEQSSVVSNISRQMTHLNELVVMQ